jgi:hypothetical protein
MSLSLSLSLSAGQFVGLEIPSIARAEPYKQWLLLKSELLGRTVKKVWERETHMPPGLPD